MFRHGAGPEVDDVETDVLAKANIGKMICAIDSEGENAIFADILKMKCFRGIRSVKSPKVCFGTEKDIFPIQSGNAVMRAEAELAEFDDVEEIPVLWIYGHEAA